jgi:RNA recognition motif-containing protein
VASKSLYVGNLSYAMTEDSLRELFAEFEPSGARVIAGRGFGFVDVPEEKAAAAIAALNGREMEGRALTVSEARPRTERGGGEGPRGPRREGRGEGRRW